MRGPERIATGWWKAQDVERDRLDAEEQVARLEDGHQDPRDGPHRDAAARQADGATETRTPHEIRPKTSRSPQA